MKIVFFGTPDYVLPILQSLDRQFKTKDGVSPIVAVITQKPRPVGRKKKLRYSPVDNWAHIKNIKNKRLNIKIYFSSQDLLRDKIKADLGVLAAYGEIVSREIINYFPHGILNIHPSLLPKYRGAAPVQAAIVCGDKETGVSVIRIDEKLDHGPIISQFKEEILATDTTASLRKRLFEKSAEVITTLLPAFLQGKIKPRPQDDSQASFTRQIKKEDGFIPPHSFASILQGLPLKGRWEIGFIKGLVIENPKPADINRFIRAMQPWPQAWTFVWLNTKVKNQKSKFRLKILKAHLETGRLVPDEVQLEGKNPVSWKQFCQGYPKAKFED